ncbi:MAG TPA: hypothetical protein VMK83_10875 [Gaiellaceae bacterium]|nr:hypothetical protein [Gaiellaceae bacterium]
MAVGAVLLRQVRAAVAKYHSFEQAKRDGYTVEGEPCVASPGGAMGIHAVNPALLADDAIDIDQPEILLYVPKDNGKLALVGVEYWKVALTATGPWFGPTSPTGGFVTPNPVLFGRTFDGPMQGHNPPPPAPQLMPWHYDMHVWVAEENPSGVFALFNPALSC